MTATRIIGGANVPEFCNFSNSIIFTSSDGFTAIVNNFMEKEGISTYPTLKRVEKILVH